MFVGEYQHSLDTKGRVILPAKFRDQLADGSVVTKSGSGDGCLVVYTAEEFMRVAEDARQKSRRGPRERQAARSFFAGAAEITPDKQGRVALPQHLRDYAGLERDVVVAGIFSRIEIWDAATWREREREGDLLLTEAEGLDDFGI